MTEQRTIALLGAAGLFFILQAIFWLLRRRRSVRDWIIRQRLSAVDGDRLAAAGPSRSAGDRYGRWRRLQQLDRALAQAGMTISAGRFLLLVGAALGITWAVVVAATGYVAGGFLLDLVLCVLAWLHVSGRKRRRLAKINQQLPRGLELMVFGLRAGHTLEESIRFVAHELQDPLGSELKRCYEEFEMGRPLEQALFELSRRAPECRSLRTFVESVLVLKQTGGNIVEIIENIITTLRAQSAYEARYRALTAEGRTSGMILGSLPLLILTASMLVQPGYIGSLAGDGTGRVILLGAIAFWAMGIGWLVRLVKPAT